MPKRNVLSIVDKVKIDEHFDMSISDIFLIKDSLTTYGEPRVYDAILIAFKYGYAMGQRAEKKKSSLGTGTTKRAKF